MLSATFPARSDQLKVISAFLMNALKDTAFNDRERYAIDLALDEACSNVIDHAYSNGKPGNLKISLDIDPTGIKIILQDTGMPFDPSSVASPDLTSPLETRSERGLGVFLIQKMMDSVEYDFSLPGLNQLTMIKHLFSDPEKHVDESPSVQARSQTKQPDYLQVIAEVSQTINSILDLDQLLTRLSELIRTKFGIPYVHIFLWQFVPRTLEYRAGSGERAKPYHDHQIAFNLDAPQGLIALAARSGKMQLTNDAALDPRPAPNPITGVKRGSELALPLLFAGRTLGVLDLQSDQPNTFHNENIAVFKTLSDNVAVAVRNASLYNSELWRAKNAEVFRETAELLSQLVSLPDFFNASLSNILDLLPGVIGSIWLFAPENIGAGSLASNSLYLAAAKTREGDPAPAFSKELKPGEAWFFPLAPKEGTIFHHKGDKKDPIQTALALPDDFSGVATTISIAGQIAGVVVLHEVTPGRYGPGSESICATFAGYLASAIERNWLDQETQAQTYYTSMMLQVAMATRSIADANSLLKTSGAFILSLIGGASVALILKDVDTNTFQLQSALGEGVSSCNLDEPCVINNTAKLEETLKTGRPRAFPASVCSADIAKNLGLLPQDTILLFPLIAHERQIGLLMHTSKETYIPQEPEEILGSKRFALLEGIAQQTAVSLQNIDFLKAKQAEAVTSNVLLQITNLFASSSDLKATLHAAAQILMEHTNPDQIALLQVDPASGQADFWHLTDKQGKLRHAKADPVQLNAVWSRLDGLEEAGHLIVEGNLLEACGLLQASAAPDPTGKVSLCFPLSVPGEVHGVLVIIEANRPGRSQRIELLREAALQIASGIQNSILQAVQHKQTLIEREMHLARQIQKSFLPDTLPVLKGYDLAVEWETARLVGGDFYDVFELSPDRFGLVIADVSDKGLPASLYMTVSRTLLRAMTLETDSPARTLEKVNHILQLDSRDGFFVTVFYGILELSSGKLTYCVAGHNPPVWLKPNRGEVQQLSKGGVALGLIDPLQLQDQKLTLSSGDALVLYTDGITETFSPGGEEFGTRRLLTTLSSPSGRSAEAIVEGIGTALTAFRAGAALADDYTLLVVRRN